MTTKKKNNKILILAIVVVAALCLTILFLAYRSISAAKNDARCEATISEVHSNSTKDPLYEPPMQYFECIDAL